MYSFAMYSKVVLLVACVVVCDGAGHSFTSVDNQNGGKFGYKVSHEYVPKEGSTRYHQIHDEGASPHPIRGVPYYAGGDDGPRYKGAESLGQSGPEAYNNNYRGRQGVFGPAAQGGGEVAYYAKSPFEGAGVQALPLTAGPAASYSSAGGFRPF